MSEVKLNCVVDGCTWVSQKLVLLDMHIEAVPVSSPSPSPWTNNKSSVEKVPTPVVKMSIEELFNFGSHLEFWWHSLIFFKSFII